MKKLLIFSLILVTTLSNAKGKTDLERYHLKGAVKSFTEEICPEMKEKFGEMEKIKCDEEKKRYSFDKQGRLHKIETLDKNNQVKETIIAKYIYQGDKLIAKEMRNSSGKITEKTTIKDGLEVEKIHFNNKGEIEKKLQYEYDKNGHLNKTTAFDANNKIVWMTRNENKELKKGREVKTKFYDENGDLEDTTLSIYDEDNLFHEEYGIKKNGKRKLRMTTSYDYDDKANWVKSVQLSKIWGDLLTERKIEYYDM
ncbi:MAG: hypothetical protein CR974_04355 [Gammaproteobacteria bacterium]|nr:MAG: hypothetical protein CR974_04355 [Gammaproteobacteria bacterium]